MKTSSYLIIKESGSSLFVDKAILDLATGGEIDPILWCQNGLFCLIPKEVVQNAIDLSKSFQHPNRRIPPKLCFVWGQGIPISNLAGRVLIGE